MTTIQVFLLTENDIPKVKGLSRLEIDVRRDEISEVLKYNALKRNSNDNIQLWKSYPGISNIVDIARKVVEEGDMSRIGKLAEMMQVHESQQSASIIATIAIIVGSKLNDDVDVIYREAIGDVITWVGSVIFTLGDGYVSLGLLMYSCAERQA